MRSTAIVAALSLWVVNPLLVVAQDSPRERPAAPARPEVLVVGVYHMSNPSRDVFNMEADDVLAPRRQAEIAEVIAVLEKFHPTKIAVEARFSSDATSRRYGEYLAGNHELTRNETEQIGFRLAKKLGHETVHAVDVTGEFPFPRLVDYAKAHGRTEEFDALMDEVGARVRATNEHLASHTVLETLLFMNSDDSVAEDVGFYYRYAHFSEPWNWAGADLVADWFRRNMRIYANVVRLADSPDERVLVIFGAGHLGWLQHNFAGDPGIRLRKLAEFTN
ncbi:MAG TPA: DUF5694 domain-containing protein [Thermoanaerobaculia bacterium]|nr:DUF5694 domain-containing protein [Thermoanaerobaculia bacterium]